MSERNPENLESPTRAETTPHVPPQDPALARALGKLSIDRTLREARRDRIAPHVGRTACGGPPPRGR